MLIVRTPLRISFAGGGTDFPTYYEKYGGVVLSATIDKYFYTILTEREDGRAQIISADLKTLETRERAETLELKGADLEIPFAVLRHLASAVSVNLFLASEVPPGTGLGSSAAVCVSILKTLSVHLGRDLTKRRLAEEAFHIAQNLLGRRVGKQDEYAASFGGLNVFRFNPDGAEVDPIPLPYELLMDFEASLMLFFTGSSRDSAEILTAQEETVRQGREASIAALDALKEIVPEMRQAILGSDLEAFGRLLHESWETKKRLSSRISSPGIDETYEAARRAGALGGKIAGAGGGGFLLLCCPRGRQESVREKMLARALKEMRFHFDLQGTRVVHDDPFFDSDARGGLRWFFSPTPAGAGA